ncbi:unnamed protein product [Brassica oleracea var. botrytis]
MNINEVLYFVVSNYGRAEILRFDVRTENLKLIQCVNDELKTNIYLVDYKERWHMLSQSYLVTNYGFLKMPEKINNHAKTFVYHFLHMIMGIKDKNIHVSYYDPKRKSNRMIKIERFEDEDFWLRNEWREHNWGLIGCIPNHIENFICVKNFTCLPSTKDQSSSKCSHTGWLPFDLIREILMRIPAASLMRFRCVSKQCASVTSDPDFIISFMNKSRSYLLINFQKMTINCSSVSPNIRILKWV